MVGALAESRRSPDSVLDIMTEPDPIVVDALFDRLCELAPQEREAVLAREHVADDVAREVRRLLEFFDRPPGELAAPVLTPGALTAATTPEQIGPYQIIGVLGSGAMGIVYRARQERPRRDIALKILKPSLFQDQLISRFEREAELLGRFQHPGIPHIFASGAATVGGSSVTYIAMEYVEGRPLTEHVQAAKLSVAERVRLLADLAEAVHYAHMRGVVHRDLKPSNVLVTPQGDVKVIDFGVARALDRGAEATLETVAGQVIGTLGYMSPEQVRGDIDRIDALSDVYALGVLAYEALGRALPFEVVGRSVTSVAQDICERSPRPLEQLEPECRSGLEWIVARAMAKEPERRYPSASAFSEDLNRWLRHEAVEAGPDSVLYRTRRFVRRNRVAVAGAAATLLAILIGSGIAVRQAFVNADLATRAAKAASEANELRRLAEERADEIIQRTDPALLRETIDAEDELWPAIPAKIPAMERWLEQDAEPLVARIPTHQAALDDLRRGALPYGEAEREYDRTHHPLLPALAERRFNLQHVQGSLRGEVPEVPWPLGAREQQMLEVRERGLLDEIARDEAQLGERWTWAFADRETQRRHDRLQELVKDLRAFGDPQSGLMAAVRSRLERARSLEMRTVLDDEPREEWARAIEAIRANPRYGGLELVPQPGLRPLREDPNSGLWEFWDVESGARPRPSTSPTSPSAWELDGQFGIVLVLIPGGRRWLGAQSESADQPNYDPAQLNTDSPLREVEVAPFFLSKYECTQPQWVRLGGGEPSLYVDTFTWWGVPAGDVVLHANTTWNPVERVPYVKAIEVLRRAGLRLPSMDEWEFAARGGSDSPWWTGQDVSSMASDPPGNLADARSRAHGAPASWRCEGWEDPWVVHGPVGSFRANPFGLHDTIGNLLEMCAKEAIPGIQDDVIALLGGGFDGDHDAARVTRRQFEVWDAGRPSIGVRPARSLDR